MLSRRTLLLAGVAAALPARTASAQAPQPASAVDFEVPAGACDCHAHVFGDPVRFPFSPARTYTPGTALPDELQRLHAALRVQRAVIVTASAYGTNNSATLDAVRVRGRDARGIVVIDVDASERELDRMHQAGVRGARLFEARARLDPEGARQRFRALAPRLRDRGWHLQIFTHTSTITALKDLVLDSPVPVVFDHYGAARGELGLEQPGFRDLLELVAAGKAYVKISGAYRFSNRTPDYDDMRPLAQALIAANPERILWATDWPHTHGDIPGKKPTDIFPFIEVDDAHLFNLFARWVPEPALRKRILVDNPARLYAF